MILYCKTFFFWLSTNLALPLGKKENKIRTPHWIEKKKSGELNKFLWSGLSLHALDLNIIRSSDLLMQTCNASNYLGNCIMKKNDFFISMYVLISWSTSWWFVFQQPGEKNPPYYLTQPSQPPIKLLRRILWSFSINFIVICLFFVTRKIRHILISKFSTCGIWSRVHRKVVENILDSRTFLKSNWSTS